MVAAVNELHDAGLAHMDIRLENVCFLERTGDAVLIDLDRSCLKKNPASTTAVMYGASTMYNRKEGLEDWTAEHIDWRQVAIMLKSILCPEGILYHQLTVGKEEGPFLSSLYNDGVYDVNLHTIWSPGATP